MNKKIIEIGIVIFLAGLGIWLAMTSSDLPEQIQWFLLATLVLTIILFAAFPKIPIDYKIICCLMLGYAFAGKGFAYISPFEPVYIGEIVWILGMIGYIYRLTKGTQILPTWMHIMILIWMITVGLYLVQGYPIHDKLAIRDSAIGYYGMFAFYSYAIFSRNDLHKTFGWALKGCVILGSLSLLVMISGLYTKIAGSSSLLALYYQPHVDAFLPLIAAGAAYALMEGIRRKSMLRIAAGLGLGLLLMCTKTAGIFCFAILMGYLIIIGRRRDLIVTGSIVVLMAAITVLTVISIDSQKINSWMADNEHLQTLRIGKPTSTMMQEDTTDWRIAWWEIIYEDTTAEDPVFGLGLGADITSHFLVSHMRIDLSSEQARTYARYPHNIIFTVYGRIGAIGLTVFMAYLASLGLMLIKTTKMQLIDTSNASQTSLLAQLVVIAGVANGVVQSTYEVPHGAIIHWVCIGYVMAYYQRQRLTNLEITRKVKSGDSVVEMLSHRR